MVYKGQGYRTTWSPLFLSDQLHSALQGMVLLSQSLGLSGSGKSRWPVFPSPHGGTHERNLQSLHREASPTAIL